MVKTAESPTTVPAKIPRVTAYLPDEVYEQVQKEADIEERSISQMVSILVREALANRKQARGTSNNV